MFPIGECKNEEGAAEYHLRASVLNTASGDRFSSRLSSKEKKTLPSLKKE